MEKADIKAALLKAYERRAANDAHGAAQIFAPNAVYRVAGNEKHSAAVTTRSGPDMETALTQMIQIFEVTKFDIASMLIDGDRASITVHAEFNFKPTGQPFSMELANFWTFEDGKAVELLEFFDTAHVNSLTEH